VAARSKAWTVCARSDTGIVGSNPTQGTDVCVRLFYVYVALCVGSGLAMGLSPIKESYRLCRGLRNWKNGQGPKGCKVIDRELYLFNYYHLSEVTYCICCSRKVKQKARNSRNTVATLYGVYCIFFRWLFQPIQGPGLLFSCVIIFHRR
jgi:hypothetical protein